MCPLGMAHRHDMYGCRRGRESSALGVVVCAACQWGVVRFRGTLLSLLAFDAERARQRIAGVPGVSTRQSRDPRVSVTLCHTAE